MTFLDLSTLQIIFLIAVPIVVIALMVFFVVIPVNKSREKKHFREYCYKAIYKIAFDEDYYLINDMVFRIDPSKIGKIDHILFGNKYIYVINDAYYDGDLTGKDSDESLIFINDKGKKSYTENQYKVSKTIVKSLSDSTKIGMDLLIGITVVNKECKISIETNSKQFYIIQKNKLKRLIRAIESRNVGNINAPQLEALVKAIDKLNRKKKKDDDKRNKKSGD